MRLVTYFKDSSPRAGIVDGEKLVDASEAAAAAGLSSSVETVSAVLRLPSAERDRLAAAAAADGGAPLDGQRLGPPVPDPRKILCIGLNYREHAAEAEKDAPKTPIVFAKFDTSLIGDGAAIQLPPSNPEMVDWEGELAVVIGRRAKRVDEEDALDHVAGYMPFNDVSGRDLQLASPQWTMGKAFDTSAPCGPAVVLVDEVPDPHSLNLRTILNGEVMQEASTSEMIFTIPRLISYISSLITLEVGDVIATGTPSGVGYARDPKRFLAAGDTIEVEIEGLGRLTNTVEGAT